MNPQASDSSDGDYEDSEEERIPLAQKKPRKVATKVASNPAPVLLTIPEVSSSEDGDADEGGPSHALEEDVVEDEEDEDDTPLQARIDTLKTKAKAWVAKNKPSKADKTEDDYVTRVKILMDGGGSSRARLRNAKNLSHEEDSTFFSGRPANLEQIYIQARLYFRKVRGISERRPTKILGQQDFPGLGRHYLLLWHDVGYADQDIEEWMPANYANTFGGLVENYQKVFELAFVVWGVFLSSL